MIPGTGIQILVYRILHGPIYSPSTAAQMGGYAVVNPSTINAGYSDVSNNSGASNKSGGHQNAEVYRCKFERIPNFECLIIEDT